MLEKKKVRQAERFYEDYYIFGKKIRVGFENTHASKILAHELSLYPHHHDNTPPDLVINNWDFTTPSYGTQNPSLHHELDDGFIYHIGGYKVHLIFSNDKLEQINFAQKAKNSKYKNCLQRLISNQFNTEEEGIGQIFHEMVLIPSTYFDSELFLLHASAFLHPNEKTVTLIGGTGGVGKTSLEIELCMNHRYKFVTDDISVISSTGHVWPNLSFPKIYAYNLEGNDIVKEKIFSNRGLADLIHWNLHLLRGKNKVRRRITPDLLYGDYSQLGGKLAKYIILSREYCSDINITEIDCNRSTSLSIPIINAEYGSFNNHILWHEYNRELRSESQHLTLGTILNRWTNLSTKVLANTKCYLISIPVNMEHNKFKQELASLIVNKL